MAMTRQFSIQTSLEKQGQARSGSRMSKPEGRIKTVRQNHGRIKAAEIKARNRSSRSLLQRAGSLTSCRLLRQRPSSNHRFASLASPSKPTGTTRKRHQSSTMLIKMKRTLGTMTLTSVNDTNSLTTCKRSCMPRKLETTNTDEKKSSRSLTLSEKNARLSRIGISRSWIDFVERHRIWSLVNSAI